MKMFIIMRFQFEAIHCWPDAGISLSAYLMHPHRHIFHVEAKKSVSHENRDIEFIEYGRIMKKWAEKLVCNMDWSCEKYAMEFIKQFDLVSCRVMEDNENGAEVEA